MISAAVSLRVELYVVPRIERPFWVFEQLEVALFEGLRNRFARSMRDRRAIVNQLARNRFEPHHAAATIRRAGTNQM
jgi:hypothetical protein